jgi:hypothetical protein
MNTARMFLVLGLSLATLAVDQAPPPVYQAPVDPPAAAPAPPPAAPAARSATELETLVAPIALYPDPLIATILPASVYPLEIVQAARFVADTNNLANLDAQPWDPNVKTVARMPAVIQKMNDDLSWTMALGEAFLAQDKELMDAIQTLRGKAQSAGKLQTTPQQVVVVTNAVVERTYEQTVVYVTNTVVQIQPSNPQVVYVPQYNPQTIYVDDDDDEAAAAIVSFGVGIAVGAIIANNCDWHYGGCYYGRYPPPPPPFPPPYRPPYGYPPGAPPPGFRPPPPGSPPGYRPPPPAGYRPQGASTSATATAANSQRWQPNQSRLQASGTPTASTSVKTAEARGWSSGGARPSTQPATAARPTPTTGSSGARPSHRHALDRSACGVSQREPAECIAQRFTTPTDAFEQPCFSVEQRLQRYEQWRRGARLQQPGCLEPREQERWLQRQPRRWCARRRPPMNSVQER